MAFTTYDNAPYLYRRSGGGGDKEIDKLVGGTIAWNQLIKNGNFADTSNWITWGGTITVSGNVATVTTPGQWNQLSQVFDWTYGHIMLAMASVKKVGESGSISVKVVNDFAYTNQQFAKGIATNDVWTDVVFCGTYTKTPSDSTAPIRFGVQEYRPSNSNNGFQIKNVMVCDLTLMFGSTIADYVYSLEQSSQGSGLAWLRSYGFFTEDYYDYNSGELKSVSNLVSHDMTGKNLFDKANGAKNLYVGGGNVTGSGGTLLCFLAKKGTQYTINMTGGNRTNLYYYDTTSLDDIVSGITLNLVTLSATKPYTFIAEHDAVYCYYADTNFQQAVADSCMVELGSTATSYEPYTLHSYPLGNVTLRGLPKLNGNALYYDGDTYESNGTVTRRYIALTVNGSESWGKEADGWMSAQGVNSFYLSLQSAIRRNYTDGTIAVNATSNRLLAATYRDYRSGIAQPNWFTFTGSGAYIDISSTLSTVDEFKTWLQSNPVTVVYELKTSTTETADTYTNPQWVDPNGTERYTLSSNAFPMPVGHETTYNTDMGSKTVNTQVNLSMTEPQVRQIYAKEGDTARVLNIHLDQTEEDGTLRILRPDGTEVTAEAVLVPEFYDGLMAEIPSDATSVVGKCYCDVEQNGVSSMPFTLNVKKNERES